MSKTGLNERIRGFLNSALKNISTKDYDAAIAGLKEAESIDSNNPEVLYNLGVCYCRKEDFESAIAYFDKVLNHSMTFIDVLTVIKMLAYCAIMLNNNYQAKEFIRKGLKMFANDTTMLNMLGYCFEKEKKVNKALEVYKKIIEIDGKNSNACNSIAYLIADTNGDLNQALALIRYALKQSPENPAYLDTMGYIQMRRGQTDMAFNYFKKALSRYPDSKEIIAHINQLKKIQKFN